jgi:LAO/AO transport system kinase
VQIVELYNQFKHGNRLALAKVITLIESTAHQDQEKKQEILSKIKGNDHSIRIAISGPPGVGKSTFINILGQKLVALGHKLAVLPIDPSSSISKGSILGDRIRMSDLSHNNQVYIRPSPSMGMLGGISLATRDVMIAVESFGFDVVLIETVGVGQSEFFAQMLCDHFILLLEPGAGDYVQAIKKGILEFANGILINKADGELKSQALAMAKTLSLTFKSYGTKGPYISVVSALNDSGIDKFLSVIKNRQQNLLDSKELTTLRKANAIKMAKILLVESLAQKLMLLKNLDQAIGNMTSLPEETSFTPIITKYINKICDRLEAVSYTALRD